MGTVFWPNGTINIPRVTSEYGPRIAPVTGASTFHHGIDLAGFPVNRSPVDGVVAFAGYKGNAGNMILIAGANGDIFMLAHNARLLVTEGQRVLAGQDVGVQGMTGVASGVHCHFEVRPGGGPAVSPRDYMASHSTTTAGESGTPIDGDPAEIGALMSLLPVTFKIRNTDANGNPTSAGLAGVFVTIDHGHGYVYPADQFGAVLNVSAPYFNNGVATPGNKIGATENGVPLNISQENLHILLRDLGFADNAVEQVAVEGGGHFYRPEMSKVNADGGLTDEAIATVAKAVADALAARLQS